MTGSPPGVSLATLYARHRDLQVLPTSFAQQRFWMLDQLGDALGSYTIPLALRLHGDLDVDALARALNAIVARHESLRTVFVLENEQPVQVVLPELHIDLPLRDLRSLSDEERQREVSAQAHINANTRFDLASGPLLRATLLRVGANEYVLFVVLHHIVADGWSVGILYRDLEAAYAAALTGASPVFQPLPLQYPDFAVWQRRTMQGKSAQKQIEYWAEALRDPPTLDLPLDRPRPAEQTMNGGKRELLVPADVVEEMRALARRSSTTPFMAFLAAYFALLHRYSGQSDLVVGSITSGRSRAEVEPLIGLFVNTLAIRARVEGSASFIELLRAVRDAAAGAYDNQDVPFEQVIERVQPARDRSRSPLFQTAFQLLEGLGRDLCLPGIEVSRVSGVKDSAKFDLTLVLHPAAGGALRAIMEYNSDLFDAASVDRMLAHFSELLTVLVRAPRAPIASHSMYAPGERASLLLLSTGGPLDDPMLTLHELVERRVDQSPAAVAVVAADGQLTYAELEARANRLAAHLRSMGLAPGNAVGICLLRDAELVIALLAILKAGAHYVPLDPEYPADRLEYILEDSGATLVLATTATRDRVHGCGVRVVLLDVEAANIAAQPSARQHLPVAPESLAYLLHTSGSTGRPKGVMIPHRAVVNLLRSMATRPGLSAADAIVAVTTLSFDIAGLELWLPLIVGGRVVVAPRSATVDGAALAQLLDDTQRAVGANEGRVLLQATPATWRLLLDANWGGTPTLRMLCGGEAWSSDLAAALLARGDSLWNVYGPTETTIWSAVSRIHAPTSITLGEPVANTTLLVLDARGELSPFGVRGELFIGGLGVGLGYRNRPELTAERFVPDPYSATPGARMYRTGDLVRRGHDGALEYLGRLDQQVKIRGFRIELGEIESVLATQPGVSQAVVAVRLRPDGVQLVAYLVPTASGVPLLADDLSERLRLALPPYMIPAHYVRLDVLPLTPNGKIDRRALPEPTPSDELRRRQTVAPRTPLERQIADVWREVLAVDVIGVDDEFFALGGHSLLAMRVVARLAAILPVQLTIGAMFEARTVAGMAALVTRRLAELEEAAPDDDLAAMLAELEDMSDAAAARLLAGGNA